MQPIYPQRAPLEPASRLCDVRPVSPRGGVECGRRDHIVEYIQINSVEVSDPRHYASAGIASVPPAAPSGREVALAHHLLKRAHPHALGGHACAEGVAQVVEADLTDVAAL
jgi:hypothetical protein